jgi:hypothetical protein
MPPGKVKGTPPPPRETPPGKAKETTPAAPAKEVNTKTSTAAKDAPAAVKPKAEATADKSHADEETNGAVGNKRRGIRLKQDLD